MRPVKVAFAPDGPRRSSGARADHRSHGKIEQGEAPYAVGAMNNLLVNEIARPATSSMAAATGAPVDQVREVSTISEPQGAWSDRKGSRR